jgi:hypothetical protein
LPLGNIGTPFLPVFRPFAIFLETLLLFGQVLVIFDLDHCGGDDDGGRAGVAEMGAEVEKIIIFLSIEALRQ